MNVGKPIRETVNIDIPLVIDHYRYFAGVLRNLQGSTQTIDPTMLHLTLREPLGVVGHIIPWNFPLLLVAWKLGGKSPHIIFPDADVERAIEGVMIGVFLNQGEVCSGGNAPSIPCSNTPRSRASSSPRRRNRSGSTRTEPDPGEGVRPFPLPGRSIRR